MELDTSSIESGKQVKIHFPTDPTKLALLLDWMWNSGDFATCNLSLTAITNGRKFTQIDIVEDEK